MQAAVYLMALLLALCIGLIVYAEAGEYTSSKCKPLIGPIGVCTTRYVER